MGQSGAIDSLISRFREEKFFGDLDAREVFDPYRCKQSFLKTKFLGNVKSLRTGLCMRKYNKSKDLYDLSLSFYDFKDEIKIRVTIAHSGVSSESIQKLLTYWTGRFQ